MSWALAELTIIGLFTVRDMCFFTVEDEERKRRKASESSVS